MPEYKGIAVFYLRISAAFIRGAQELSQNRWPYDL